MGTAARKAISAGLHKEAPAEGGDAADSVEERRSTFWALYFYEVSVSRFISHHCSVLTVTIAGPVSI